MTENTKKLIEVAVNCDQTATAEERNRLLQALNPAVKRRLGTVRKAAEILDSHPRTVARYAAQGKLTVIRLSARRLRYDLDQVSRFASEGVA